MNKIDFLIRLISLFLLLTIPINAQTVTGKVVDQNGMGLAGLKLDIYLTQKSFDTISNADGSFVFNIQTRVKENELPTGYVVSNNYPNPFNPTTRLGITMPTDGKVKLEVYNILGQKLNYGIERFFNAGTNFIDVELNGLPNGVYIARIVLNDEYTVTKKLMLLYGSQHLMPSNNISFTQQNKPVKNVNSIMDTKIDSIVVTDTSIVRTVFTNLPDIINNTADVGNLVIDKSAPTNPAQLLSPLNNAINISTSPTLTWNAVKYATNYHLLVYAVTSPALTLVIEENVGNMTSKKINGLKNNMLYDWYVEAMNNYGITTSDSWNFKTIASDSINRSCPNLPTITYEGKTYNTVQIGTQCWLRENLDVGKMIQGSTNQTDNGIIEKYCYNDDPDSCAKYGGLYKWDEAMLYTIKEQTKGICPDGWHIPSISEARELSNYGGNALKEIGQGNGKGAGTNLTGFAGLLAGAANVDGGFIGITTVGTFQTSTQSDLTTAYYFSLYDNTDMFGSSYTDKRVARSVRCVKD